MLTLLPTVTFLSLFPVLTLIVAWTFCFLLTPLKFRTLEQFCLDLNRVLFVLLAWYCLNTNPIIVFWTVVLLAKIKVKKFQLPYWIARVHIKCSPPGKWNQRSLTAEFQDPFRFLDLNNILTFWDSARSLSVQQFVRADRKPHVSNSYPPVFLRPVPSASPSKCGEQPQFFLSNKTLVTHSAGYSEPERRLKQASRCRGYC